MKTFSWISIVGLLYLLVLLWTCYCAWETRNSAKVLGWRTIEQLGPNIDEGNIQLFVGLKWRKIYTHDISGGFFENLISASRMNVGNESALLYSILYDLDLMRDDSGVFHFKLCYPELTQHAFPCNEWIQSSNPVTHSLVKDFVSIHLTWPNRADGKPFAGLMRSNPGHNLMDDDPSEELWWNSVGTIQDYQGKIPGPANVTVSRKEFYVYTSA